MKTIINLEKFPLDYLDSQAGIELINRCKNELVTDGMFNLEGFLLPNAIEQAVNEVKPLLDADFFLHERQHNIYFKKTIPELDDDHPALKLQLTSSRTICADQFENSVLIKVYEYPAFAEFLARVMDKETLYTMADPLARVNVMAYRDGQALNWHFDRSEFTTTLLLQSPAQGGDFEYRTDLRFDDDPNYEGVVRLLNNQDPDKKLLQLEAGTLNVFKGKNTAHRVTPVVGDKERIITVFSYYQQPDVVFSEQERIGFYGRAR